LKEIKGNSNLKEILRKFWKIGGNVKEIVFFQKKSKEYGNFQGNALQNMLKIR
jgi:hypothetical protein